MKKILTITVAAMAIAALATSLTLTSCEKKGNGKWDPNAMISLRPDVDKVQSAPTKAEYKHLTAHEIVEQAATMTFYNKTIQENPMGRSFGDHQRDTINNRLLMFGTDIIGQNGEYIIDFVKAEDVVLYRGVEDPDFRLDTIAYIPNKVLRDADKAIKTAYDEGDYATCYDLFDKAFVFRPVTGPEWRELKAQGLN